MKNTIFFDLDGTLINSTDAIVEGFGVAYESLGDKVPDREKIVDLIGHPLDFMFIHLGVQERVGEYVNAYKLHYRKISKLKTEFLPFAKEAIIKASKIANVGAVTTKTGRYSKELLEHMKVLDYFDILIGREDVINPKPHPEPIIKAMIALETQPRFCWMIGDTPMDIVAAREAGIRSIAVLSGYSNEKELSRYARVIKPNAYEAVCYIEQFIKAGMRG